MSNCERENVRGYPKFLTYTSFQTPNLWNCTSLATFAKLWRKDLKHFPARQIKSDSPRSQSFQGQEVKHPQSPPCTIAEKPEIKKINKQFYLRWGTETETSREMAVSRVPIHLPSMDPSLICPSRLPTNATWKCVQKNLEWFFNLPIMRPLLAHLHCT